MIEFKAWPKTPRLFRDMIITEKIDGTNACIIIEAADPIGAKDLSYTGYPPKPDVVAIDGEGFRVAAQSRKRLITPETDNFGFAGWVRQNASVLASTLGVGYHFGEWWGSGIQRGYGLQKGEKRFSLFNVQRYEEIPPTGHEGLPALRTVPVLHRGRFSTEIISYVLECLGKDGSEAQPGFSNPEGIVVFHSASGQVYKALLENDELPKGLVAA